MRKRRTKWISILMIVAMLMCLNPVTQAAASDCILMKTNLVAGQNKIVGTVSVKKTGMRQISVTYSIDEHSRADGWRIYETQLAIGKCLSDIPQTRNKTNLIPGKFPYKQSFTKGVFEYTKYVDVSRYAVGTKLYIAAHAVVKKGNVTVAPYGGSRVYSYDQGVRYDGTNVLASRSNPNQGLYYELGMNDSNFYSLGFTGSEKDGWLIIEFDKPITNGTGNDLRVIEDTWGLPYPVETAKVSVSQDGVNWVCLGDANNQNPISLYHTATEFDIGKVGLCSVRFVKLQDRSDRIDFGHLSTSQGATLDGFDVNAVLALHDYVETGTCNETAWGSGIRFAKKCSWGMYFTCVLPNDFNCK